MEKVQLYIYICSPWSYCAKMYIQIILYILKSNFPACNNYSQITKTASNIKIEY